MKRVKHKRGKYQIQEVGGKSTQQTPIRKKKISVEQDSMIRQQRYPHPPTAKGDPQNRTLTGSLERQK